MAERDLNIRQRMQHRDPVRAHFTKSLNALHASDVVPAPPAIADSEIAEKLAQAHEDLLNVFERYARTHDATS